MSQQDAGVFPKTLNTWIGQQLDDSAERTRLHDYLLRVYAPGLLVYLKGWKTRPGRDEDELRSIVHSFFASRLGRADFLPTWRASGRPLRAWLMTGLKLHVQELRRRDRTDERFGLGGGRDGAVGEVRDDGTPSADGSDVEFLRQAVREALAQARASSESAGVGEHWRLFERYRLEEASIAEMARELGAGERRGTGDGGEGGDEAARQARVRVMIRTAQRHFVRCLREVIAGDIGDPEKVDAVLGDLIEIASR